tara:strand:+ start:11 stop:457 length:447 start_codon:yes stop_codon:yes gene_type:complete
MNNHYCLVGVTLLLSSFFMSFIDTKQDHFYEFNDMLNEEQQNQYKKIILERTKIYIIGTMIGLLAGLYYIIQQKNKSNISICKYLAIVLGIQLIFYKIHPKSKLMLHYLTTKEQVKKWAEIYTYMKTKWITSLVFGFFGFLAIGCSLK